MNPLTRDLLQWVDQAPRSYDEAMQTWQSTCPRFTIWEDALEDRLIRVVRTQVLLTQEGAAALGELSARPRRPG
ncbi:MAG TPA: hypothetical protein VGL99_19045 [Chloroflexota bacterium]|jgi:hypothetical protein